MEISPHRECLITSILHFEDMTRGRFRDKIANRAKLETYRSLTAPRFCIFLNIRVKNQTTTKQLDAVKKKLENKKCVVENFQ